MTRIPTFSTERERLEYWAAKAPKGQRNAAYERIKRLTTAELKAEMALRDVARLAVETPARRAA